MVTAASTGRSGERTIRMLGINGSPEARLLWAVPGAAANWRMNPIQSHMRSCRLSGGAPIGVSIDGSNCQILAAGKFPQVFRVCLASEHPTTTEEVTGIRISGYGTAVESGRRKNSATTVCATRKAGHPHAHLPALASPSPLHAGPGKERSAARGEGAGDGGVRAIESNRSTAAVLDAAGSVEHIPVYSCGSSLELDLAPS